MRRPEIGANSYLLDLDGTQVILDSGMHPKEVGSDAVPDLSSLPFNSVPHAVITHSHLDHVGSLPLLQRNHPSATINLSDPTLHLTDAMLHNSVNVMSSQREELGLIEYPLFTHREVEDQVSRWRPRPLRKPFNLDDAGAATCEFYDAGHILGSVGAMFRARGKSIFYTGDVNFEDQTIARHADFPIEGPLDLLIMECTRGDAPRHPEYRRENEVLRLAAAIREGLRKGGSVLIPVFAMGKSQEILMMLNELRLQGEIPAAPIFVGGLSTKMTRIYDQFADRGRRHFPDFKILTEMDLQVTSRRKKKSTLEYHPGAIYALSSGMMSENTVSNEFAFQFLPNANNSLLFVGYTDPDSPAGRLKMAEPGTLVSLNPKRPSVRLMADIQTFDFSGHADRDTLRAFANRLKPKKILLVHGDAPATAWFQATLSADMPGTEVRVPPPGEKISIG